MATAKRKTNPAPRLGTTKPKRASQRPRKTKGGATTTKPSKRLVARRKANTRKGYFPNPKPVYLVYCETTGKWVKRATFSKPDDAEEYARWYADKYRCRVRVMSET